MPYINESCRGCKICLRCCMFKAIKMLESFAVIDEKKCVNCGVCLKNICPFEAIKSI